MKHLHRLQWPLLVIAIAAYIYFPVYSLWTAGLSSNDFKHIYLGMKAILDGNAPYEIAPLHHQAALQGYQGISLNPYVYLPFTGHAMALLAPLRLEQAIFAWFALNHIFTISSLLLLSLFFKTGRIVAFSIMLLSFAFSAPFFRTLSAGQLNLALLLLITLGWHLLKTGHARIAGAVLAFATLFKLMPGLYGLYFILRRKWQSVLAMAATGAALLGVSVLLSGFAMYAEFLPILQQMGYGKSTWPHVFSFWDDPANQSLNSFFSHIFTISDHTRPWAHLGQATANIATVVATAALAILYTIILLRRRPTQGSLQPSFSPADEAAFSSTLLLALLVPSLLWDHYLVMLILPVASLTHICLSTRRYTTAGIVAICYAVTCFPWNFEAPTWRTGAGIFFMSLKLWPTLVLFGLSLCSIRWSVEVVPPAEGSAPPEN